MKSILLSLAAALLASVATAQPIAIKDHPQGTVYPSPAEWLEASFQCHVQGQRAQPSIIVDPTSFDPLRAGTSHTHLEPGIPYLGVITGPFEFGFYVRLFMSDAQVVGVWGPQVRNIVWDDTGSEQMPVMSEVASDHVKFWHARAVFDPFIVFNGDGGGPVTPHGYFPVNLFARTVYATTDGHFKQMDNMASVPVYMLLDPSAPEAPITHYSKILASRCTFRDDADPAGLGAWGVVAEEIREIVPIAPISTPWTLQATREFGGVFGYTYASQGVITAPSHQQMRIDPDLHAGNGGTLIDDQVVGNGVIFVNEVINPIGLSTGPRKAMFLWNSQTTAADAAAFVPNNTVVALITLPFVVDPNAPPSPPFTPAPPPIAPPPPPPPPAVIDLGQAFGQLVNGLFRICVVAPDGSLRCVAAQ